VSSSKRPFPPGGLPSDPTKPYDPTRLYKMAYDLAYRTEYLREKYAVDGLGSQTAVRRIRAFEIHVEFQMTVPSNLIRYTVMIWFEEHLVFHAWCARTPGTDEEVGLVVTCEDGPWKSELRRVSEAEEKS